MALPVEAKLRRFQLALAAAVCVGILVELLLTGHTESAVQFVPIVLSVLALPVLALGIGRPALGTIRVLRVAMVVLLAAGAYGIFEHFEHNLAFEMEIRPNATFSDVWKEAIQGASPPLAPGALTLVGLLGLTATYRHPEMQPPA